MKSIFLLLSLMTISFISTACQPVNPDQLARERAKMGINNNSTQPPVVVTSVSITGNWAASCVVDSNKTQYRQDSVVIGSNYIISTSNYFSDSNCVIPLFSQESSGIYTLTNDQLHGTTSLNVTLSDVSIMPETAQIVSQFKQTSYCGFTGWQLGQRSPFANSNITACGIAITSTPKIQRNGQNELYLNAEQFLKQ